MEMEVTVWRWGKITGVPPDFLGDVRYGVVTFVCCLYSVFSPGGIREMERRDLPTQLSCQITEITVFLMAARLVNVKRTEYRSLSPYSNASDPLPQLSRYSFGRFVEPETRSPGRVLVRREVVSLDDG